MEKQLDLHSLIPTYNESQEKLEKSYYSTYKIQLVARLHSLLCHKDKHLLDFDFNHWTGSINAQSYKILLITYCGFLLLPAILI